MVFQVSAYYLYPPAWVGNRLNPISQEDLKALREEVFRTTLDAGISCKVRREGMFVFDFSHWLQDDKSRDNRGLSSDAPPTESILRQVTVLNVHLACLYTAISRRQNSCWNKMVVSPENRIVLESLDSESMGPGDSRTAWLALSSYPQTYGLPITADHRIFSRLLTIELATIEESFGLLGAILRHSNPEVLLLTDLHLRGCKAFEDHYYSLCLVTAWTIIEKLLRLLWESYIDQNRDRGSATGGASFINADRKKKLTEGRDFGAAMISEILSLVDRINFSLYTDISEVRRVRNDWIHGLRPVPREAAAKSAELAEQMLSKVCGLDLKVPLSWKIHG
jgi:hypothetical protein